MSEQSMANPRVLKIAVIVMGAMLVIGFGVVLVTIALRVAHPPAERIVAPRDTTIPLRADGQVRRIVLDGRIMAIEVADSSGSRIVVVDLSKGRTTDVIRFVAPDDAVTGPQPALRTGQ